MTRSHAARKDEPWASGYGFRPPLGVIMCGGVLTGVPPLDGDSYRTVLLAIVIHGDVTPHIVFYKRNQVSTSIKVHSLQIIT
jgi:hypothetical protein